MAWTTNAIDLSPLGLFGKLSVNVGDLYKLEKRVVQSNLKDLSPEKQASIKKAKAKAEAASKQKQNIADYFIQEMYLGAEMCMDRNYVAMHKLDPLFSYEALVSVMAMDVTNKVKAAACRLLFCLHVDRDPQVGTKIPCLTRTWSEILKNETPQLPYVEPSRRNVYALIQHLCSEHIRGMAGKRWDEYSKYILEMHKGLITFNFYGSVQRLKDVITPTIEAIDRRKVEYSRVKKGRGDDGGMGGLESQSADAMEHEDDGGESHELTPAELKKIRQASWYGQQLEFLESLRFMMFILTLVLWPWLSLSGR